MVRSGRAGAEPRRLPQIQYLRDREFSSQTSESLCCARAAHFLRGLNLSHACKRIHAIDTIQNNSCKVIMYLTPLSRNISREGFVHASIPLSRDVRQPSLTSTMSFERVVAGFLSYIIATKNHMSTGSFVLLRGRMPKYPGGHADFLWYSPLKYTNHRDKISTCILTRLIQRDI